MVRMMALAIKQNVAVVREDYGAVRMRLYPGCEEFAHNTSCINYPAAGRGRRRYKMPELIFDPKTIVICFKGVHFWNAYPCSVETARECRAKIDPRELDYRQQSKGST